MWNPEKILLVGVNEFFLRIMIILFHTCFYFKFYFFHLAGDLKNYYTPINKDIWLYFGVFCSRHADLMELNFAN